MYKEGDNSIVFSSTDLVCTFFNVLYISFYMKEYIYAFIPKSVLTDNRLTSLEKLLLIHIVSLCKNKDYCWTTNGRFCDIYKVSRQTISKSINNLTKLGYLRNDYDKFKVNGEKRKIFLSDTFKLEIKSIRDYFNTGIQNSFTR